MVLRRVFGAAAIVVAAAGMTSCVSKEELKGRIAGRWGPNPTMDAAMAYIPSPTTGQWFGLDKLQIKSLETKYPTPAADDVIDPASYAPGPQGGSSVAGVPPGRAHTN